MLRTLRPVMIGPDPEIGGIHGPARPGRAFPWIRKVRGLTCIG